MKNNKWITIKILKTIKQEIETTMISTGRFSNVPDYVEFVVRRDLDRMRTK